MKLIKMQDKFILVSDEEIRVGDWYFDRILGITKSEFNSLSPLPKIVASTIELKVPRKADESKLFHEITNTLPKVDFSLLSEEDCKRIGWIDVEKFAENQFGVYEGFIRGFNKAQSLNDKMFSLEAVEEAFKAGQKYGEDNACNAEIDTNLDLESYIKTLQKTEWNVEVEMECAYGDECPSEGTYDKQHLCKVQPKITNCKIKVTKIL